MSSIPTIKIDRETAQRVDNKWDDGNLATGGFVSDDSLDTYTVNPQDQNYNDFKTKIVDFMLDENFKGDLTPGNNNFKFKQFAEAINNFSTVVTPAVTNEPAQAPQSPIPQVTDSTATTQTPASTPTPSPSPRRIRIDFSGYEPVPIIATRPKTTPQTAHSTATDGTPEPPNLATTSFIPTWALDNYCYNFAKDDLSLVHYLNLVYAHAKKSHPETSGLIQVEDLNIPGVGAQQHRQNIIAYFSTSPAEALLEESEGSAP